MSGPLYHTSYFLKATLTQPFGKDGNITWPIRWEGEQALPALARALRSERLAVKAAQMNPKLLRVSVPWEKC